MIYSKKLEREFIFRCGRAGIGGSRVYFVSVVIVRIASFTQHHHLVGHDLHTGMFLTFLIIPASGLQASFNIDLLSLYKMLLADLGKLAPGYHLEPLRFPVTLAIRTVP